MNSNEAQIVDIYPVAPYHPSARRHEASKKMKKGMWLLCRTILAIALVSATCLWHNLQLPSAETS
jgi:hypothetical protein